ncbi:GCN5-related N-acetyltransferase [Cavenderia fasciculata]|uniref:GCN5-related N-acetyltransferase n=1 Tax=Cavenderia fasciculata TaxID=261658 RepID=F4PHS5_CACFS|nr:GCN5-related N-acetyltransferase [Cavenderia fasciculata]EGG25259.1 GCN5-related N-acetyltransferase [Cavenderia fasciculata]|eukprot:XP_004363110.1 GCN5-related N-acetyltransferase [Cavenderia fasciculata]
MAIDYSSFIELGDLTDKNIGQLKLLNTSVLPVSYDDKFYQKILAAPFITKLAFYNDVLVGAVSCRVDPPVNAGEPQTLYIMTFCVLAAYRKLGIGKKLLEFVETTCAKNNYCKVTLHVQVNSDAIDFYKKYDFTIESTIQNYYRNIEPTDCYLMAKLIPVDPSAVTTTTTATNPAANNNNKNKK